LNPQAHRPVIAVLTLVSQAQGFEAARVACEPIREAAGCRFYDRRRGILPRQPGLLSAPNQIQPTGASHPQFRV
jgi:hypothetical protein